MSAWSLQSDLLSLAASISGQAEAKKQERLERLVRQLPLSSMRRARADLTSAAQKSKPAAPVKPAGKEPSAAKQKQLVRRPPTLFCSASPPC